MICCSQAVRNGERRETKFPIFCHTTSFLANLGNRALYSDAFTQIQHCLVQIQLKPILTWTIEITFNSMQYTGDLETKFSFGQYADGIFEFLLN